MQIFSLLTCLGLAVSVSPLALAQPLTGAGRLTDTRVERVPIDLTTPRDGMTFGGELVTMRDELENFPLNTNLGGDGVSAPPTSFTGPSGFAWPMNNLRGQPDGVTSGNIWVRVVDLSAAPVGGSNGVVNASRALRIQTASAVAPGGFYFGSEFTFGGQPGEPTLPLAPVAGQNARVSAELYISTIEQLFTFEAGSFTGFITSRLLWGGTNDDPESSLPLGLVDQIYALDPCDDCGFGAGPRFVEARYCIDAGPGPMGGVIPGCSPHPGFAVGDIVTPPIGNWSRFATETTPDGRVISRFDKLDGAGESIIYRGLVLTSAFIDRVNANTSFESQGAFLLIDNIEASGPVFGQPKAPPLDCPYLDDMEWLDVGPLGGQNPRWDAALSSAASVVNDGVRGQVISQVNNISSDNHYRREVFTRLLPSSATVSNDLVVSVQVRTTISTVRGFALFDDADLAARVFFGRDDPFDPDIFFYEPSIYAQINPLYDPIDDPLSQDPYDNITVIGVDVADTEQDWMNDGQYRTLEMRLSANGALRVSIDNQRIYAGAGAFSNTIDRFDFESENQAFGKGSHLRINDVTLACDAPSCAADFNLDDVIDFADLNAVLSNFGQTGLTGFNPGDADADGVVNFADLNAVLAAFGTSCD